MSDDKGMVAEQLEWLALAKERADQARHRFEAASAFAPFIPGEADATLTGDPDEPAIPYGHQDPVRDECIAAAKGAREENGHLHRAIVAFEQLEEIVEWVGGLRMESIPKLKTELLGLIVEKLGASRIHVR